MPEFDALVSFGRDVCGDLTRASAREWLVTGGNGAFASGTIDGSATRKYHGLLFAALDGPAGRTLLFVKADEAVTYAGTRTALSTDRWATGAVEPSGFRAIERFFLDGTTPVWQFAFGDALLEKRITLEPDANATVISYELVRASSRAGLEIKAIVDYRDFHGNTHDRGGPPFRIDDVDEAVRVRPPFDAPAELWLRADRGERTIANIWYREYDLPAERERGLDDREDHVHAATFTVELEPGETVVLRAATAPAPPWAAPGGAFLRCDARDDALLRSWHAAHPSAASRAPAALARLVLAAGQFVVRRPLDGLPEGHSIIAGYPWFGDWGRDAMIALPGLLLATGRYEIALSVLRTFARFIDGGMLPNTIPDRAMPAYNTVDAALWFVEAVRAYVHATRNPSALDEFFAPMESIVAAYVAGTRYGIHVDPRDDLVVAGSPQTQLTWMDATVHDRPVTPRDGKPVEINALWYNALETLASFAPNVGADSKPYRERAARVRASFVRYRGGADGGLFDTIDGSAGSDASIRPNQLFAASLAYSPLDANDRRAVVDLCARRLLTPFGLRSLAPDDPAYIGRYAGDVAARDGAYHQGTVWGWLIGPFAEAHARVHNDRATARSFIEPLLAQLETYGLGTLGEIFDGDAPHAPRGAIAQAWTVAEVLRVWHALA